MRKRHIGEFKHEAVVQGSCVPLEVLKIVEIEKPEIPEEDVLVRVHACSVNIAEWYGMTGLLVARLIPKGRIKSYHLRKMSKFLL